MSLRFRRFRRARFAIVAAALMGAGGLLVLGVTRAQAQITPLQRVPILPLQMAVPKVMPVIEPQLKTYLVANKIKLAPAVLDKQFFIRDNLPAIRLATGQEFLLLPLATFDVPGPVAAAPPAEMSESATYWKMAPTFGKSMTVQINPNIIKFVANGVDHRPTMSPIRDQGPRGTCVAHASMAALEAFPSVPKDLSEQFAYNMFMQKLGKQPCDNSGLMTTDSAGFLAAGGTVTEAAWNYSNSIPACSTTVPAAAAGATKYKIQSFEMITDKGTSGDSIKNPAYLETILNKGYNIVLGTHVAWNNADAANVLDVVIDSSTGQPAASRGGHAMLIVGYNRNDQYFIVKNSWGTGFGHAGYAYLSYDYARTYFKYGYYVKSVV